MLFINQLYLTHYSQPCEDGKDQLCQTSVLASSFLWNHFVLYCLWCLCGFDHTSCIGTRYLLVQNRFIGVCTSGSREPPLEK